MFTIAGIQPMALERMGPLAEMYALSPFVWHAGDRYALLLRAVNHAEHAEDKVSRVYYGQSGDGLRFTMADHPVIAPGPEAEDTDGCEDPTLIIVDGTTYVYYSGWNQTAKRGQLLLAVGVDAMHLQKRGVAIPFTDDRQNPKEASIVPVPDGTWRLFYEYSHADASRIGIASAPAVGGPWRVQPSIVEAREGRWDGWHLSPGPVLWADADHPVMFYNGATRDTQWRIGWIMFDAGFTHVVDRGDDPLITPPPGAPDDTDIAFAASALDAEGEITLYYSVADKDLMRARLRRVDSSPLP